MPRALVPLIVAAAASLASAAHADSFVGFNAGRSQWANGACFGGGSCDRGDTAWAFKAGVGLVPLVSVEARYFDLGRARSQSAAATVTFPDGTTQTVSGTPTFKAYGAGVGASVAVPVAPFFAVTGLAGVSRVRAELSGTTTTASSGGTTIMSVGVGGSRTTSQPYYGIGVRFTFAPNLDASLEAQRYRAEFVTGKTDVDVLAAGLAFRF